MRVVAAAFRLRRLKPAATIHIYLTNHSARCFVAQLIIEVCPGGGIDIVAEGEGYMGGGECERWFDWGMPVSQHPACNFFLYSIVLFTIFASTDVSTSSSF